MRFFVLSAIFTAAVVLAGCSKSPSTTANRQATVTLTDGSTFSGAVTKSSAGEITLQSPTGESRTYPMSQVSAVQYAAAPVNPSGNPASIPAPQAPQASNALPPPPPSSNPAPEPLPPPGAAPPPVAEFRTIPAGTTLTVRNNEPIDAQTATVGQTFSAIVARDVRDGHGTVVIPRGSSATLVMRADRRQGTLQGRSELMVDVGSVAVAGHRYRLETSDFVAQGRQGVGKNKRTGEFIGGGTALGTILGAVAGGGKGAAIGALSGAAAGTVAQGATRGKPARIPSESLLNFRLEAPVRIQELQ